MDSRQLRGNCGRRNLTRLSRSGSGNQQSGHSAVSSPNDRGSIRKRAKQACYQCRVEKYACTGGNSERPCDRCHQKDRMCRFTKPSHLTHNSKVPQRYASNCHSQLTLVLRTRREKNSNGYWRNCIREFGNMTQTCQKSSRILFITWNSLLTHQYSAILSWRLVVLKNSERIVFKLWL